MPTGDSPDLNHQDIMEETDWDREEEDSNRWKGINQMTKEMEDTSKWKGIGHIIKEEMIKGGTETTIDTIVPILTTKEVPIIKATGTDRIPMTTIRDSLDSKVMDPATTSRETKVVPGANMKKEDTITDLIMDSSMEGMIIDREVVSSMEEIFIMAVITMGGQIQEHQQRSDNNQPQTPQQPANPGRSERHGPTCHKYGKPGHYAKECTVKFKDTAYFERKASLMRNKERGVALLVEEENWVCEEESSDEEDHFMEGHRLMTDFEGPHGDGPSTHYDNDVFEVSHVWYIGSGAYRHMIGHRSFLFDYVESSSQFCDSGYWVKQFLYGSAVNDEDGNVNFKDMNKLVSRRLVTGLSETRLSKDTLCPVCDQGKMKRSSHPPKMETNCKHPVDWIHMDLCGPMRVESMGRKKYILVLVDEFSRYTWLEFLRAKFDAANRIIAFIKCIQTLLGHRVKKLRSDNGTEFQNAKLQSFLEDVGISHNFSIVCSPQQNGVVERNKRILVEAVEAVSTACFTQNRTLIVKRTGKTTYEQSKPNIDYFKVFGCKCYVLNDRDDLGKFDPKSNDSSNAIFPELSTPLPRTDFAPNTFASDFIDPADNDLPTLMTPIVVAVELGSSSTSVSSDAFVMESSSVLTANAKTSTEIVTPELVVSPPQNSSTEQSMTTSSEPVQEQTTSLVLAPILETAPLPSPGSSQRTYAQVVREPRVGHNKMANKVA
ncbi:hypothetical protein OSB04_027654 [Centaurea solstitialis]|uniref:Integrase catalytic domain-containing protein n=1 Tax=Centaurea solstitialis TaxID=347529 RepID=A0AA38SZ64_9ASTR|nr:hypothetical protein OSB04_027654 [Centaurea solstitialis]